MELGRLTRKEIMESKMVVSELYRLYKLQGLSGLMLMGALMMHLRL